MPISRHYRIGRVIKISNLTGFVLSLFVVFNARLVSGFSLTSALSAFSRDQLLNPLLSHLPQQLHITFRHRINVRVCLDGPGDARFAKQMHHGIRGSIGMVCWVDLCDTVKLIIWVEASHLENARITQRVDQLIDTCQII